MFLLTLVNAHVKNDDSSVATGEAYRKEAENNVPKENRNHAFLVGDFNIRFSNVKVTYDRSNEIVD